MLPIFLEIALFLWIGVLSILFYRMVKHYNSLTRGSDKKELKTILEKIIGQVAKNDDRIVDLDKKIMQLEKDGTYHIQKVGLVRFNPFSETGGDQSFCLAVLDENDSGFVISSLHSRNTTRLYAKSVEEGQSLSYELSEEEKKAIKNSKRIK